MSAPNDIDVNVATAEEIDALLALKGHGFEIVRYRRERGRLDALRQLEEVPGLASKVAELDSMVRFGRRHACPLTENRGFHAMITCN